MECSIREQHCHTLWGIFECESEAFSAIYSKMMTWLYKGYRYGGVVCRAMVSDPSGWSQ
jgi:hypothetical protein